MDNKMNPDLDLSQAMRIAQDPAAIKFMESIRRSNAQDIENALQKVSCGNFAEAQIALQNIMKNPEALAFLEQFGRQNGRSGK